MFEGHYDTQIFVELSAYVDGIDGHYETQVLVAECFSNGAGQDETHTLVSKL